MGRILSLPFTMLWGVVRFIFAVTGRLLSVIVEVALVVVGVVLSLTVIGAIIGIPLVIIGAGLILKGIVG